MFGWLATAVSTTSAVVTSTTAAPHSPTIINNIPKSPGQSTVPTIVTAAAGIIAVLLGGAVTYFATARGEAKRQKHDSRLQAAERVRQATQHAAQLEHETILRTQDALIKLQSVCTTVPPTSWLAEEDAPPTTAMVALIIDRNALISELIAPASRLGDPELGTLLRTTCVMLHDVTTTERAEAVPLMAEALVQVRKALTALGQRDAAINATLENHG